MSILYSLVVPYYNDAERLGRLLHSVPIAREDVEVIVVDDCSLNQKALDAVRTEKPRVHWLSTLENAGAGVARNVGLDAARGRWLVFADSDDEFLPGAFDTFDRVLRADDELVYFLAEAVQEIDGHPSIRSKQLNELVTAYQTSPSEESLQQLRLQHVVPWAKVYSRAFIKKRELRFDPIRRSNDVAFNVLAAIQAPKVRVEAIPVYRIYRRAESLTADVSATAFLERFLTDRSVAIRLAEFDVQGARSATGHMLSSLQYGPKVALKVWWLAIRSPMRIQFGRIFEFKRWWRFFMTQRRTKQEQTK